MTAPDFDDRDPFEAMKTQLMGRLARADVDLARVVLDDVSEDEHGVFYGYVAGSDEQGFPDFTAGVEHRHLPNA